MKAKYGSSAIFQSAYLDDINKITVKIFFASLLATLLPIIRILLITD